MPAFEAKQVYKNNHSYIRRMARANKDALATMAVKHRQCMQYVQKEKAYLQAVQAANDAICMRWREEDVHLFAANIMDTLFCHQSAALRVLPPLIKLRRATVQKWERKLP